MKIHPECPFTKKQVEKFISKLVDSTNGCKCWTGCYAGDYGRVGLFGTSYPTHRASYLMFNGPIPDGMVVRHKCDNPACSAPEHLEIGTQKQNSQDMVDRGRDNWARGERCALSILKREQVVEIKTHLLNGTMNQTQLAEKYGCDARTVNAIRMGYSWAHVPPFIPDEIPTPHRQYTDSDHMEMRQMWHEGFRLKQIAEKFECRIDTVQAIVKGKRGIYTPTLPTPSRANQNKHSEEVRAEILRRYLGGETQLSLAAAYGLSKNGINLAIAKMRQAA